MLSEVPWMKSKVIAEPDLSISPHVPSFSKLGLEATSSHVTIEMHKKLTIAMEAVIKVVTANVISHVSLQMQTLVQDFVGCATAHVRAMPTEVEYFRSLGKLPTHSHTIQQL